MFHRLWFGGRFYFCRWIHNSRFRSSRSGDRGGFFSFFDDWLFVWNGSGSDKFSLCCSALFRFRCGRCGFRNGHISGRRCLLCRRWYRFSCSRRKYDRFGHHRCSFGRNGHCRCSRTFLCWRCCRRYGRSLRRSAALRAGCLLRWFDGRCALRALDVLGGLRSGWCRLRWTLFLLFHFFIGRHLSS